METIVMSKQLILNSSGQSPWKMLLITFHPHLFGIWTKSGIEIRRVLIPGLSMFQLIISAFLIWSRWRSRWILRPRMKRNKGWMRWQIRRPLQPVRSDFTALRQKEYGSCPKSTSFPLFGLCWRIWPAYWIVHLFGIRRSLVGFLSLLSADLNSVNPWTYF
jgi:hypothetical protein